MARKLSLCFLGDAAAPHLRRWVLFFAARGHEVNVITLNKNVLPGYAPVKVHVIPKAFPGPSIAARLASAPLGIWAVRRLIHQLKPDIVHAHSACGYAWLGMWSGVRPLVISPWGTDILEEIKQSKISHFLTIRALGRASLVHTDGENVVEELKRLGVPDKKILLSRFGVDIERYRPAPGREEVKISLGLQGKFVVLSTRTLTPVHDVGTVIGAVEGVCGQIPNAAFVIVGDGAERGRLELQGAKQIAAGSLRFVGAVEEDRMAQYLQAADVFVSTSLHESGLSASTAEAMACSLPVINSNSGDIAKWVVDGVNGYIAPLKDAEAIASRIIAIHARPEDAALMGRRNRERIAVSCNRRIELETVENYYLKLASEN